MPRGRVLLAVAGISVAVHVTNIGYRLFYDDYHWLLDVVDVRVRSVALPRGSVFRPTVVGLFGATHAIAGSLNGLPYHVAAVLVMAGAAVAASWLALRLGASRAGALAAGTVVGAHATLGITTIWVSASTSSLALLFALSAAAVALGRPTWPVRIAAGVLMLFAVGAREIVVLTPVLLTVTLLLVEGRRTLRAQLVRTAPLWLVTAAFVVAHFVLAAPVPADSPYRIDLLGGHLFTNLVDLARWLSRFGVPTRSPSLRAWDVVFWLVVAGAVVFAARRGSRLAIAGGVWLVVSLLPPTVLPNKPMEAYYVDFALVGLALVAAAVVEHVDGRVAVAGVALFAAAQFGAMALVRQDLPVQRIVDRTDVLERRWAHDDLVHGGVLTVRTPCARADEWSRDGDLFRVLLDDPDLRVRFVVVHGGPHPCGTA